MDKKQLIVALAKSITEVEAAAQRFVYADNTEVSQLRESELRALIEDADALASRARALVHAAGDLLNERQRRRSL